jgi:hypothetical protein
VPHPLAAAYKAWESAAAKAADVEQKLAQISARYRAGRGEPPSPDLIAEAGLLRGIANGMLTVAIEASTGTRPNLSDGGPRYALFAGEARRPLGGVRDFQGAHETVENALAQAASLMRTLGWFQIVDASTWTIVAYMRADHEGSEPMRKVAPEAIEYWGSDGTLMRVEHAGP